ncbi:pentatricopeptide repeat-containing protein At3g16610-like [Rutidosis leptorrhynchoides]|uniref:pentatricopeptide repeat-containing protein At3g16610-like n=1 Tax=Rutidosis leptorrhynchoides TaxID=125765 RepID=UPI003A98F34A
MFRLLRKRGVKPDSVTYNTLIDGYIKNLKEDVAIKVFSTMPKQLVNKVTYFLLSGLITRTNHHHYRSAKLEYRDDIKCSYLHHLYIHGGSYEKALDLFDFMDDRHELLNSNIQVYNTLIFGANKCGRFDVARKLFHQLTVKGLQPDEVTCTLIIRGFCQVSLFKDAKRMFVEMKQIGSLSDRVVDINQIPLCYLEKNEFNG